MLSGAAAGAHDGVQLAAGGQVAQQRGRLLGGLEERLEAWLEVVLCAEQQRLLRVGSGLGLGLELGLG